MGWPESPCFSQRPTSAGSAAAARAAEKARIANNAMARASETIFKRGSDASNLDGAVQSLGNMAVS